MNATNTGQELEVEVSEDRLRAWISFTDPNDPQPITAGQVVAALEEARIAICESVLKRVNAFVVLASASATQPARFLIAEGRPAVEGTDATFQRNETLLQQEQDWQGEASVSYYTYTSIHFVQKDDPIGVLVAAIPGVDGIDVLGKTLTPLRSPMAVKLGGSIRRSGNDAAIVLANVPGQIAFRDNALSISEVLTVANDVDFETGNIESPVDVQIGGTVRDGFSVKSQRGISISGAIEAAIVQAEDHIIVRGGILQKHNATVKSGGDIVARFCDEADLRAVGDVKVCNELISSHVHTDGSLFAAQGAIIGGYVYAREGIEAATLGSDANRKTELVIGMHPSVTDEVDRIRDALNSKKEKAEHIRSVVQPLMADLKRLSPTQKEKATELIFHADTLDTDVAESESECEFLLEKSRAKGVPYVRVSNIVHPGVTLRIGRRGTTFGKAMRGPVKIEERKIKNTTEFVAVNQLTGSIKILPSCEVGEDSPGDATQHARLEHGGSDGQGR